MSFGEVRMIPVNGKGPEDVLVDAEGQVYTGLADGRIVRVGPDGDRIDTVADTGGRPLGLEFFGPDELLVCDAQAGLLAVELADGKVRVLEEEALGAGSSSATTRPSRPMAPSTSPIPPTGSASRTGGTR